MGSSPVTAIISPCGDPLDRLRAALAEAMVAAAVAPGESLVVAFSGGADSTALLLGLALLAPRHRWQPWAIHVDHRLDPGSRGRAGRARELAAELGLPFRLLLPPAGGQPGSGPRESGEAAARRLRYALLEEQRRALGARWTLTAHHADDQAETVLLRMAMGSGVAGLAAMAARRGAVLRPLLGLGRSELERAVAGAGLDPIADPTNADLSVPRNRMRHLVLPTLGGTTVSAAARRLATAARGAAARIEAQLDRELPVARLAALRALPPALLPWALARLHRQAGVAYPPRARAVAALRRQLAAGGEIDCDCGAGWRWVSGGAGTLGLAPPDAHRRGRGGHATAVAAFAYTVEVPGGVEIREAATTFRLTRQPVASWMRHGASHCAALDLPLDLGAALTVRSRRPGDRLQPLGSPYRRRLKEVLIDRKVPREARERIPLLCVGSQVAWVPGVTIHDPFRLREGATTAWVAELLPLGS